MRTLLSIMLIGTPVMLILTLVGITHGFMEDSRRRAQGVGADIIVRPPGSSFTSGATAPMPQKLVERLAREPHVVQSTGVVQASTGKLFNVLTGIDPAAFDRMSGGFIFLEGHTFQQPRDILVDTTFAAEQHLHAGSRNVKLLNTYFNVAGVVETGKLSHLFLPMAELQELTGQEGKISQVYLKVDDKKNIDAVVESLKSQMEGYPIYSMKEWLDLTSVDNIQGLAVFMDVIIGIGVVIGFAVVSLSMYMAVLQRTREIGILKSMGATKSFVMTLILWEAAAMGLGGTLAGIALSFGSRQALKTLVPASLPQAIVPVWWPIVAGIALGAAFLGALYPGMIAVRHDPIEALAHE
jgi:putative ABC transport system permease protein